MGFLRQSCAIGFGMIALTLYQKKNLLGFILMVAIASTFHNTAIALLSIPLVDGFINIGAPNQSNYERLCKAIMNNLELFEDVLDLAGQNQSVGVEILSKLIILMLIIQQEILYMQN